MKCACGCRREVGDPTTAGHRPPLDGLTLMRHLAVTPDGCWTWTGYVRPDGYAAINGRLVHRIAWETFRGHLPGYALVKRSCGHRLCANPDHLYLDQHQRKADAA